MHIHNKSLREFSLIWFLELMNVEHMEVLYLDICIEVKTKVVVICFIIENCEKIFSALILFMIERN